MPPTKVPPLVMTTFKIFAGVPIMLGAHAAPEEGAVTVHVRTGSMVGSPESVMRMAEVPTADVMVVAGVNVTNKDVTAPLIWEVRVTAGATCMAVKMAGKLPVIVVSR